MNKELRLNPSKLVQFLEKPAKDFTKEDIIRFVEENGIKMLNFRYTAGDGRLKTLNFVINNRKHLEQLLTIGERVDGSSLFSYVKAESSDLYVVPRYRTAFVNPFMEEPTLDFLCYFFTNEGTLLESAPDNILKRAHNIFKEETGMQFEALGELEYYLFSETDTIFPITEQKGYHEAHPFSKWGNVRREAMKHISQMGCHIKYGHAEVGNIIHNDVEMVQHEIEFLPIPVEEAADEMVLAKWVVRETAYKYGLEVSFAPKIMVGQAGSGLHFHTRVVKDGKNLMVENGTLSDLAKKVIAGYLTFAPSLTAFGNTVPTSYLRLVPHQEAPTSICWGDRNRSVLVRVPLGWNGVDNMTYIANPEEPLKKCEFMSNQTVEIRNADGSANVHELLAGLTIAALYGIKNKNSLKIAAEKYIDKDANNYDNLDQLPASCFKSADKLSEQRDLYEANGIFPPAMIDSIIEALKSYDDEHLSEDLYQNFDALTELVDKYLYCG